MQNNPVLLTIIAIVVFILAFMSELEYKQQNPFVYGFMGSFVAGILLTYITD
jgi:hypothetical protein